LKKTEKHYVQNNAVRGSTGGSVPNHQCRGEERKKKRSTVMMQKKKSTRRSERNNQIVKGESL